MVLSCSTESFLLPALPHRTKQSYGHPDKSFESNESPKGVTSGAPKANVSQTASVYEVVDNNRSTATMPSPYSSREDSLADIPLDLSILSQKDVITLLQKMNLRVYEKTFSYEQVDGSLLMDLDQDILIKDFGFDKFHAWKLS